MIADKKFCFTFWCSSPESNLQWWGAPACECNKMKHLINRNKVSLRYLTLPHQPKTERVCDPSGTACRFLMIRFLSRSFSTKTNVESLEGISSKPPSDTPKWVHSTHVRRRIQHGTFFWANELLNHRSKSSEAVSIGKDLRFSFVSSLSPPGLKTWSGWTVNTNKSVWRTGGF